jgi:hypothetical protein
MCRDPKKNLKAVGDYLHGDGPFEGKDDDFDPIPHSKERYEVQLNLKNS